MIAGVIGNPSYPQLEGVLGKVHREAERLGIQLRTEPQLSELWPSPVSEITADDTDVIVTLGGDGTLLRGARVAGNTPVVGINFGRLGFLTTAGPGEVTECLERLASKDYTIEERALLNSMISSGEERSETYASLNDVVVHQGGVSRVIVLKVSLNGEPVGQYSSDGIVVATPTGSTAYSLSAGGPILAPDVDAVVITPISPHTLSVRPLVVSGDAEVAIELAEPTREKALVSFDGQFAHELQSGEKVVIRNASQRIKLVRMEREGFFATLRTKLHWGDLGRRISGA